MTHHSRFTQFLLFVFLLCSAFSLQAQNYVHHNFEIQLNPIKKQIEVTDTITLPKNMGNELHVLLHAGLSPKVKSDGAKLKKLSEEPKAAQFGINAGAIAINPALTVEHFLLSLPEGAKEVTLTYGGEIFHPVEKAGEEYARSFSETPGIISEEGVYLCASTYWYPWFNNELVTFEMNVTTPVGWETVSQGERVKHDKMAQAVNATWASPEPQDDIYLIAAKFTEYSRAVGGSMAMAFLRTPDDALANKYLETTAQYLEMYRQLLGAYPYKKFALIENFWETGYGMPSFTLLGEKVIRFPFILHSSYPHEILHNWWGNSVYVDYETGNWCEGLTAYLADHLIQEQRGSGVAYRRAALQKYTDYVKEGNDFPLTEFRSRHSSATEAVGYGKTLMIFHMLRQQMGDDKFSLALQRFYRNYKFKKASFGDVESIFSGVAEQDLKPFFQQWVEQKGAPELRIKNVSATNNKIKFTLEQSDPKDVFALKIPVAVQIAGQEKMFETVVEMNDAKADFELEIPGEALQIKVDPQFDIFRRLHREEIPPAFSQVFGAEEVLMILPANGDKELLAGYKKLGESWQETQAGKMEITTDAEISALPNDKACWIIGNNNRFAKTVFDGAKSFGAGIDKESVTIGRAVLKFAEHSIVLTARNPQNPDFTIAFLSTQNANALAGLSRKLPHYGKYSYLAFQGDEPANFAKGQWDAVNSPMIVTLDKNAELPKAKMAPRSALATLPPVFSDARMKKDVEFLASDELQGRGFGTAGLNKAADYIKDAFAGAGLKPGAKNGTYFQKFFETGGPNNEEVILKNVIGIKPGVSKKLDGQSIVVGAHYDHLGLGWPDVRKGEEGKIHHGADDNASGVAVMLELLRVLKDWQPDRTVIFIAFSGEEAGLLGSKHYVKNPIMPLADCFGMLNLDTVGRLGEQKLLVLGTGSASEWVHIFRGAGYVTGVNLQSVADDFGSSDQKSFIEEGIPAVQFFSGPHLDYHRSSDTAEKIDYAGMVKTASILKEAVEYMATREERLTVTLENAKAQAQKPAGPPKSGRRVSLGSIPDFAFSGPGVKITGTTPGSAAEAAGMKAGDIITKIGEHEIADLRALSGALKAHKPGDNVTIVFKRGDAEMKKEVVLKER
ncbi:MAG: M20/M25/M40 family metallo-hydrolase [Calditrichaeota bacterium]|nr:MAG: M20/M25/M40 family metallo-hydrolase [Calditrichota bacterium]